MNRKMRRRKQLKEKKYKKWNMYSLKNEISILRIEEHEKL